ncbi:LTA synthase family protein [Orbaceae bacterium ESL0721]|nr:LTA synthase family protein [Orbaceae bacterium ESL0721]
MPLSTLVVLPLLIITIILASLFKRKTVQLTIIVLFTIFTVMELTSIYFSGGFIDYQFFVNLNIGDIIEGLLIFKWQAVLVVGLFLGLILLLYWLTNWLRWHCQLVWRLLLFILAIISLNFPYLANSGTVWSRLYEIYQVTSAPKLPFQQAQYALNMQEQLYKTVVNNEVQYSDSLGVAELQSEAGKNIIVISLESFEQGFFDFKELTPNLNQLKDNYTFFAHMPMSPGSSWTAASMYTYMTGVPFLIGGFTSKPLATAEATKLITLADVLQPAGYQTRYVIGGANFAGIGHLIKLVGVDTVSEADYPGVYPAAPFGLYDKDIFTIAKQQVDEMHQANKPFALFISTVSTHAPNGFRDDRMASVITPKTDSMAFAAASLDYNLGQFIRQLDDEGLLANTVFYIFPDHLMMGAGTETIKRLSQKERSLYLLTNADEKSLQKSVDKTIYQIDLPRLILNGAKVQTNATFLTDYLAAGSDKRDFIRQNKRRIATLNRSAAIEVRR